MNKPLTLRPGNTVGIVSTSSPVSSQAVETMRSYFENRGYRIKIAPHVLEDQVLFAGSAETRAEDFNQMLHDHEIRMIVTAMGGKGAEQLLPLIDYPALAGDPKIVLGLSNPSNLLNAIAVKANVPAFHGPNGVEFGGLCPFPPFSEQSFWPMVAGGIPIPYTFPLPNFVRTLRGAHAVDGRLFGGHLGSNQLLIGTPYAPKWEQAILFLEEDTVEPGRFDRMLSHFRLAGVFARIRGLIIGQPVEIHPEGRETLEEIVLRQCRGYNFPILSDLPAGHTDDKLTLPLGCRYYLDPSVPALKLLESPTR